MNIYNIKKTRNIMIQIIWPDQIKETSPSNKIYNYIRRNCENQFSQVVDIKTLVSDIKILCTVDQDVFHCQIFWEMDWAGVSLVDLVWPWALMRWGGGGGVIADDQAI